MSSCPQSEANLLSSRDVNGNGDRCLSFLFIGYQDQPISVSSNDYHALWGDIRISFFREPDDLFNGGKIKAS